MEVIVVGSRIFLGVFLLSSSTCTRQSKRFRSQLTKSFHGALLRSLITLATGLLSRVDAVVLLRDQWVSNQPRHQNRGGVV